MNVITPRFFVYVDESGQTDTGGDYTILVGVTVATHKFSKEKIEELNKQKPYKKNGLIKKEIHDGKEDSFMKIDVLLFAREDIKLTKEENAAVKDKQKKDLKGEKFSKKYAELLYKIMVNRTEGEIPKLYGDQFSNINIDIWQEVMKKELAEYFVGKDEDEVLERRLIAPNYSSEYHAFMAVADVLAGNINKILNDGKILSYQGNNLQSTSDVLQIPLANLIQSGSVDSMEEGKMSISSKNKFLTIHGDMGSLKRLKENAKVLPPQPECNAVE